MYIPEGWIKHKKNESVIRQLLEKSTFCIKSTDDLKEIENRLKELGEEKILDELKKGSFGR